LFERDINIWRKSESKSARGGCGHLQGIKKGRKRSEKGLGGKRLAKREDEESSYVDERTTGGGP